MFKLSLGYEISVIRVSEFSVMYCTISRLVSFKGVNYPFYDIVAPLYPGTVM